MLNAARRVVALGALAAEARVHPSAHLAEAARLASGLAGDLLATRGARAIAVGAPPTTPALISVAGGAWAPLAVLAVAPGLLAPYNIDWRLRAAAAAFAIPRLELDGAFAAFAEGVSVIADEDVLAAGDPLRAAAAAARVPRVTVNVLETTDGWRVVFPSRLMLARA